MGEQIEGILDTNVILRYLVGDNPAQQKKVKSIFKDYKNYLFYSLYFLKQ